MRVKPWAERLAPRSFGQPGGAGIGAADVLAKLGLDIERFGSSNLMLSNYPALLGRCSPKDLLRAVVDSVLSKERTPSHEHLLHDRLSFMACHAALRAGDQLSPEAIKELLTRPELTQNSHHCPHGRPTSLRFMRHYRDR